MKVGSGNTRFFAGDIQSQQTNSKDNQNKLFNFFNGNNKNSKDKVAQKRQEARDKAMKLIMNAYSGDKAIDDDLNARRDKVNTANNSILEARKQMKELDKEKDKLKEMYGITEDSQEQQDLKLLEKRRDSMKVNSEIVLTEDEMERLAEIDRKGMTEYQKASLEIDSWKGPYENTINEAKKVVKDETLIIREMRLERLKSAPMVGAAADADEIMEAANKEIIGMVVDDAKDNIDKKMEETKEEMQEAKEKKEEQDERIEEIQERIEEMEAANEARREENKKHKAEMPDLPTDEILALDEVKSNVQQEVNNMLNDMKLLVEDLKGSVVDEGL